MPRVETVTPSSFAELAGFLAGFPDEDRSGAFWLERFHLWWEKNPAFDGRTDRGWVLRDNARLVGFFGCVPALFQLHGEPATVFSGTTWRVEEPHRGSSLALLGKLIAATRGSVLFATSPIPLVIRILKTLKFRDLPWYGSSRSIYVADPVSALRPRLDRLPAPGALAQLGAPGLRGLQAWRTREIDRGALRVESVERADASFDALWERRRSRFSNATVRSAEVLNWYCYGHSQIRKTLLACHDGGKLVGFAICRKDRVAVPSSLRCLDLWIDRDAGAALPALIAGMRDEARRLDCALVIVPHFSAKLARDLEGLGLFQSNVAGVARLFRAEPATMDRMLAESCYLTDLEGDYGL